MKRPRITISAVVTLFLTINNLAPAQDVLEKTVESRIQAQDGARSSQNRINNPCRGNQESSW